MLILQRKPGESLVIGEDISITADASVWLSPPRRMYRSCGASWWTPPQPTGTLPQVKPPRRNC